MAQKIYPGIHNDPGGGMNPTGNIIRDAWVFGIHPGNGDLRGLDEEGRGNALRQGHRCLGVLSGTCRRGCRRS